MRIAIFSDVHGNLTALETVLADIRQQAPDWTIFAGDLCVMGARPAACVALVREHANLAVYGNTDEWLHTPPPIPDNLPEAKRKGHETFHELLQWTREKLDREALAWLKELPFSVRVSPTAVFTDDLLVAHANPQDVMQPIFPADAAQLEMFGSVRKTQSEAEIMPLFAGVKTSIFAYGHVHMPNVRKVGDIMLANISSVNIPQDGDGRAKYGLLTWDKKSGWTVTHRRVAYNVHKELELLSFVQPPDWESISKRTMP